MKRSGWSPHGLSSEDVRWAYRILLDRDPERDEVMGEKLELYRTVAALRADIMQSNEFAERNPDAARQTESMVIKADIPEIGAMFLDLADEVISLRILRSEYERVESQLFRKIVQPGMRVADIGANVGYYTILVAHLVGPTGSVDAFEPLPRNAELLQRSIESNGFGDRTRLHRVALADRRSTISLTIAERSSNSGGAYLVTSPTARAGFSMHTVEAMTLPDAVPARPLDVIKIDIEGAEPLALRGAEPIIVADRPFVLCELHARQLRTVSRSSPDELIEWFEERNYACHAISDEGLGGRMRHFRSQQPQTVAFVPR